MSADEDYPSELDLTGSSQEAEKVEEDEGLCVGPPPGSDFGSSESDYYENSDENRDFYETNDEYGSGEDDFDIEAYFGETQPVFPPLESLNDKNGKREDAVEIQETFQEVDETGKEIMRVTLTAALSAGVEFLENGFEPEDINKCLTDIGYCLESLTIILMGSQEFMKDMPQLSSLEYCHVLVKEGWLRKGENGKFFAIFPDTDEYYVTSLIRGNEKLREMETTRKQKAEIYESEEEELRVLRSFNLIAELLHAVRNDYQQKKIRYGIFANEYNLMVKQKKYPAIYEKYSKFLPLDPEKPWNSVWFNAHCKRSSLQKFVRMSRFSEIIVNDQQPTEVYFRADMEPENRAVRLFTERDFEEVRQKHRSGNAQNKNFGRNYGGGAGGQKAPKPRPQEDPNYQPSRLDTGSPLERRREEEDDGSLMRRPSPPPPSDEFQESHAPPPRNSSDSRAPPPRNSSDSLPPPRNSSDAHGSSSRPPPSQPIRRIQHAGDTSSDEEFSSEDGCYSSEDAEQKDKRLERREQSRKKREEQEARRRKKHEEEERNHVPPVTRFQRNRAFRSPNQSEDSGEEEETQKPLMKAAPGAGGAPKAPEETPILHPRDPTPLPTQEIPVAPEEEEEILPPTEDYPTHRQPARISNSTHNEQQNQSQVPYRPAPTVLERNRMEMEKRKNHVKLTRMREEAERKQQMQQQNPQNQQQGYQQMPQNSQNPQNPPQILQNPQNPQILQNSQNLQNSQFQPQNSQNQGYQQMSQNLQNPQIPLQNPQILQNPPQNLQNSQQIPQYQNQGPLQQLYQPQTLPPQTAQPYQAPPQHPAPLPQHQMAQQQPYQPQAPGPQMPQGKQGFGVIRSFDNVTNQPQYVSQAPAPQASEPVYRGMNHQRQQPQSQPYPQQQQPQQCQQQQPYSYPNQQQQLPHPSQPLHSQPPLHTQPLHPQPQQQPQQQYHRQDQYMDQQPIHPAPPPLHQPSMGYQQQVQYPSSHHHRQQTRRADNYGTMSNNGYPSNPPRPYRTFPDSPSPPPPSERGTQRGGGYGGYGNQRRDHSGETMRSSYPSSSRHQQQQEDTVPFEAQRSTMLGIIWTYMNKNRPVTLDDMQREMRYKGYEMFDVIQCAEIYMQNEIYIDRNEPQLIFRLRQLPY